MQQGKFCSFLSYPNDFYVLFLPSVLAHQPASRWVLGKSRPMTLLCSQCYGERIQSSTTRYDAGRRFLVAAFYQVEKVPLQSLFSERSYHEWALRFVTFLKSMGTIVWLFFILLMADYTDQFFKYWTCLAPLEYTPLVKSIILVASNAFYIALNSFWYYV